MAGDSKSNHSTTGQFPKNNEPPFGCSANLRGVRLAAHPLARVTKQKQ